jgi:hypothetical protein
MVVWREMTSPTTWAMIGGEAEGKILELVLEEDVLRLLREEDDGCGRVGGAGKKE